MSICSSTAGFCSPLPRFQFFSWLGDGFGDEKTKIGISAALSFLELRADEKWPFEQFRKALEDPGMEGTKPEARWQMLNASLNAIKRAVHRG
jgi:hypothetical protein